MANFLPILCTLFLVSCQYPRHENRFIVSDGYVGPVLLILVDGSAQVFRGTGKQNVYEIPENGVLCVASFDNFTKGFGITRAQYRNGVSIPLADNTPFNDNRFEILIQRWSSSLLTSDGTKTILSDPEILFAIGNSEDISRIRKTWSAEKPQFKRDFCADGYR
jgi:hypothetical protein